MDDLILYDIDKDSMTEIEKENIHDEIFFDEILEGGEE